MKPFNLEEYLKNPEKKVVTRDGRNAIRLLYTNAKGDYPIIVLIERTDGSEYALSYTKDGKYIKGTTDNNDLFFVPEKHERWINLYRDNLDFVYTGNIYNSKNEAKDSVTNRTRYITTVKIEWEE